MIKELYYQNLLGKDNTESLLFIEKEGNNLGYKPDLLKEEIPSFLRGLVICSKCEGLTRDACGIGSPQTFVCLVCTEGNPHSALRTNREVVGSLIILCPLKSRGCGWEGVISSAETHLDTCEYFHNECHLSCGAVLKRIDMNTHLTQECTNRTVECEFCTESHRADKLTIHLEVCANFPLQCVNECGETIQRQDMKSHIKDVCSNTLLECNYKKYGCCDKVERKHLDTHNNDNRLLHMEMKIDIFESQIQYHDSLDQEMKFLTDKINIVESKAQAISKESTLLSQNVTNFVSNKFRICKEPWERYINTEGEYEDGKFLNPGISFKIDRRDCNFTKSLAYFVHNDCEISHDVIFKINCRGFGSFLQFICLLSSSSHFTDFSLDTSLNLMNIREPTPFAVYENMFIVVDRRRETSRFNSNKNEHEHERILAEIPFETFSNPTVSINDVLLLKFFYRLSF